MGKKAQTQSTTSDKTPQAAADDISRLTYEQAIEQIESIVGRIESGDMGLEEQIEEYSRGAALLGHCRTILARCEQRVEEITVELENADEESPRIADPKTDADA